VIEFVCSMSVKEMCRVLFPYEAANEDELTLKEGDLVTLLSREVPDQGWWRGELRGKVGVFPDNFVEVVQQDEVNEFACYEAFRASGVRSTVHWVCAQCISFFYFIKQQTFIEYSDTSANKDNSFRNHIR